ncbi:hypothetical protein OHU34_14090 [Streptomyces sp. NBC_00080]|uniref:hypothetical protein n=1 Tax=Streptomyces TaxID=1883 RepID=UPI00114F83EA|nr:MULTISPECIES: hypothetical protein [Streptomyces]TQJ55700.1 hypothetical protein FBY34_3504 [Streptomyces sp. SLBN-115]
MRISFRAVLHDHYMGFLAIILVTGVILIIAGNGISESTSIYPDCVLGVAGPVAAYALTTPPGPHTAPHPL